MLSTSSVILHSCTLQNTRFNIVFEFPGARRSLVTATLLLPHKITRMVSAEPTCTHVLRKNPSTIASSVGSVVIARKSKTAGLHIGPALQLQCPLNWTSLQDSGGAYK